jgi:multidrug efflux pump subunit AcrA (membrane-fusion protein)
MLMRISLIVAILAALGAGTLNVLQVRDKINTLISQREGYHDQLNKTQDTLAKTQKTLDTTQKNLDQTKQQLTASQTAQKKAEENLATQTKLAADLTDKLAKANQDLDTTRGNLAAYVATGKTPAEILQLVALIKQDQDTIAAINGEKTVLNRTVARLNNELAKYKGPETDVKLRADLKGKVVVVDPKWDFVVLDIGDEQGVLENGELLVSRDGKLVAKVVIRTVEKDRSIANIMPGWKLGEVFEGDEVTPAHPAS